MRSGGALPLDAAEVAAPAVALSFYKNGQKTPWLLSLGMNGRPEQSQ